MNKPFNMRFLNISTFITFHRILNKLGYHLQNEDGNPIDIKLRVKNLVSVISLYKVEMWMDGNVLVINFYNGRGIVEQAFVYEKKDN